MRVAELAHIIIELDETSFLFVDMHCIGHNPVKGVFVGGILVLNY
jgi:hypothetical protein